MLQHQRNGSLAIFQNGQSNIDIWQTGAASWASKIWSALSPLVIKTTTIHLFNVHTKRSNNTKASQSAEKARDPQIDPPNTIRPDGYITGGRGGVALATTAAHG
jgi:hypothetical protein